MNWLNDIVNDFKYGFLRNMNVIDVLLILAMFVPLIITFMSERIAKRFKTKDDEIQKLSIKIKGISLLVVAVLAIIITQV